MSLAEPLTAAAAVPASDLEVGRPESKLTLLTRHARSIILSLSLFSSLLIAALAVSLVLLLSPSSPTPKTAAELPFFTTGNPQPIGQTPPFIKEDILTRIGRDMDASRNLSVDPCDDFYRYSCGGWIASTQLTPSQARITKGFALAAMDNAVYIREVIEADWPIVTPFFQACQNIEAVNRIGFEPARFFLDGLDPTKHVLTREEVFGWMGALRQSMRVTSIFSLTVGANSTNPRQPILNMAISGTTLANANMYIGANNQTARLTAGITRLLTLAGDDPKNAASYAQRIVEFETALVAFTGNGGGRFGSDVVDWEDTPYVDDEDEWVARVLQEEKDALIGASNNYYGFEELETLMPDIPVRQYLMATGLPEVLRSAGIHGYAQLTNNATFVRLNSWLKDVDPVTLQLYLRWHALNVSTPYLSVNFMQAHLEAFDLEGITQVPDRYQVCSTAVVSNLQDLFGRYFMARRLPPEMKTQARSMITWIRQAFERNLPNLAWMDDDTRRVAAEKAYAMLELVGGPENGNWSDYSAVMIRRDRYFENWMQIQSLRSFEDWQRLTGPLTRARFTMNPSIVNAQYSSTQNAMQFPAGILVDPFYNGDFPMSMNLGAIGLVMGHEMIHGFDNNGRQFDKDGLRRQWWADNVITAFVRKSRCLVDQYDNILVQGSRINGTRTLGENIADNGGLHMAFLALQWYKDQLRQYGMEDPVPDRRHTKSPLSSDQLFYWAHAQTWCTKSTDESIATQVGSDAHSPGEARVWAPVVNQQGFAEAFHCPVGSKMNPPQDRKCDLY